MKKLVFASNNAHKLEEVRALFAGRLEIVSLADIGCHEEIPETADTLEGNALIKARHIWEHYGMYCFADDTGLEVAALDGAPGVYSARFAGEHASFEENVALLLARLEGVPAPRQARFRTVIALIDEYGTHLFEGAVDGEIPLERSGAHGFGYDPVFRARRPSLSSHRRRRTLSVIEVVLFSVWHATSVLCPLTNSIYLSYTTTS